MSVRLHIFASRPRSYVTKSMIVMIVVTRQMKHVLHVPLTSSHVMMAAVNLKDSSVILSSIAARVKMKQIVVRAGTKTIWNNKTKIKKKRITQYKYSVLINIKYQDITPYCQYIL